MQIPCEKIAGRFKEVKTVVSQTGRPDDGTDPEAFSDIQCDVILYPKEEWKRTISKDSLIDEMNALLAKKHEGVVFNFSQPIRDNVEQAVSGMNAALGCQISGDDFAVLNEKSKEIYDTLTKIKGIEDLGVLKNLGQPELDIDLEQSKMGLYGVNVTDANAVVQMAIGGQAATQVFEGERLFDLRVRYAPNSERHLKN